MGSVSLWSRPVFAYPLALSETDVVTGKCFCKLCTSLAEEGGKGGPTPVPVLGDAWKTEEDLHYHRGEEGGATKATGGPGTDEPGTRTPTTAGSTTGGPTPAGARGPTTGTATGPTTVPGGPTTAPTTNPKADREEEQKHTEERTKKQQKREKNKLIWQGLGEGAVDDCGWGTPLGPPVLEKDLDPRHNIHCNDAGCRVGVYVLQVLRAMCGDGTRREDTHCDFPTSCGEPRYWALGLLIQTGSRVVPRNGSYRAHVALACHIVGISTSWKRVTSLVPTQYISTTFILTL